MHWDYTNIYLIFALPGTYWIVYFRVHAPTHLVYILTISFVAWLFAHWRTINRKTFESAAAARLCGVVWCDGQSWRKWYNRYIADVFRYNNFLSRFFFAFLLFCFSLVVLFQNELLSTIILYYIIIILFTHPLAVARVCI